MKIKLLTSRAGIGFSQHYGEVIEVGADEGAAMIARGEAELVREQNIERAVKAPREKAIK
jgi:hypothetical protein